MEKKMQSNVKGGVKVRTWLWYKGFIGTQPSHIQKQSGNEANIIVARVNQHDITIVVTTKHLQHV